MPIGLQVPYVSLPSAGGCARRRPMCSSGCAFASALSFARPYDGMFLSNAAWPAGVNCGELEAVAAIAAVAAAAAAAEAVPVRRPDAGEIVRIERQVRVEELQIPWTAASTAGRRTARGRRGAPLSRHRRGQEHRHEQPYLQILHHCAFAGVFTGHPGVKTPADWVRAQRSSAAFVMRWMSCNTCVIGTTRPCTGTSVSTWRCRYAMLSA